MQWRGGGETVQSEHFGPDPHLGALDLDRGTSCLEMAYTASRSLPAWQSQWAKASETKKNQHLSSIIKNREGEIHTTTMDWAAPTVSYLWPTRTELSRKVSEIRKGLGRNISVICPGSCRVTEIQITSPCPSKNEFFTSHFCDLYRSCAASRKSFLRLHFFRERKLNTNFFFSNFSGNSGISRQNPGISRPKSLISLVSRDVSNFLAPTRSRGRPPPHPKISGPKSLGLGSFFFPDF